MKLPLCALLSLLPVFVLAQTTPAEWQKEAIRAYPELGKPDSKLNQRFLEAVKNARNTRPNLFANPRWPLVLAEELVAPAGPLPNPDPNAADPTADIERALQGKRAVDIVAACIRFTHKELAFRANILEGSRQIAAAAGTLNQARKTRQSIEPELERLRRNAAITNRPNVLDPKDTTPKLRAEETLKRAEDLEKNAESALAAATSDWEGKLAALGEILQHIRAADSETAGKQQASMQESQNARDEQLQQAQRTKAMLAFHESVDEPEGLPGFAAATMTPSYAETLEFLNGKLPNEEWKLRFGAKSKQFILLHPEGAYLIEFGMLNAAVKPLAQGDHSVVRLDVSRRGYAIRSLPSQGGPAQELKRVVIPCTDAVDAEKLANAFRHLILMSGGKDDIF